LLAELDVFGEVELRPAAAESECGLVVSSGGGLCGLECAEPDTGGFVRVADLRYPFAPWPLPDSPISPSYCGGVWLCCGGCGLRSCENALSCCCTERGRVCVRDRGVNLLVVVNRKLVKLTVKYI